MLHALISLSDNIISCGITVLWHWKHQHNDAKYLERLVERRPHDGQERQICRRARSGSRGDAFPNASVAEDMADAHLNLTGSSWISILTLWVFCGRTLPFIMTIPHSSLGRLLPDIRSSFDEPNHPRSTQDTMCTMQLDARYPSRVSHGMLQMRACMAP